MFSAAPLCRRHTQTGVGRRVYADLAGKPRWSPPRSPQLCQYLHFVPKMQAPFALNSASQGRRFGWRVPVLLVALLRGALTVRAVLGHVGCAITVGTGQRGPCPSRKEPGVEISVMA